MEDIFLIKIFIAVLIISIVSSLVGTFTFLQKKALISDAISHAVLPGIVFGFVLSGNLNPWLVLLGAIASGWLSIQFNHFLQKFSHLKSDALLAISLSAFLALGLSMLSYTQLFPEYSRSGLTDFLFGKITAINNNDLLMMSSVCIGTVIIIFSSWRTLIARSFDVSFVKSRGIPIRLIDTLFNILIITTVAISVQAIGVVLTSALLIFPVAVARIFMNRVRSIVILAVALSVISTFLGTIISVYLKDIPTGPAMVLMLAVTYGIAVIIQSIRNRANG